MTRREALRRIAALNLWTLTWLAGRGEGLCDMSGIKDLPVSPTTVPVPAGGAGMLAPSGGPPLHRGLRVMVFAPHPDDETLGAGGLLQLVRASQGTVRVVFVTCGDGYVEGARNHYGRAGLAPKDFIEYGRMRWFETVRAMKSLGVGNGDMELLGFPDAGIHALLSTHWGAELAYVSPHTLMSRPPYPECRDKDIRYTGSSLSRSISDSIAEFSPHWVVLPDPLDRHPDHRAVALFVLGALSCLDGSQRVQVESMRILTYFIRTSPFPASPEGARTAGAAGHGAPSAVRVPLRFALGEKERRAKEQALLHYTSQQFLLSPVLSRFVAPFEVFGQVQPVVVTDRNCLWNRLPATG